MKKELIFSFEESLFDDKVKDLTSDIVEIGLDSCLEDGIFKDIPIVGMITKVGNIAQKIYDRHLLKQTLIFINELNNQEISQQKIDNYIKELKSNPKKASEELGRVLLLLNRNIEVIKSKILAQFFLAYIKEAISWEKFVELTEVLDRMYSTDFNLLKRIALGDNVKYSDGGYSAERLMSMGLFANPLSTVQKGDLIVAPGQTNLNLSNLGKTFCQHWIYHNNK